ncbi:MAG: PLP-dependent aminotransferase family protein [Coriobacteriales bacterium]|jgi:GntR family transcriptional regulator/MocR family aminotransferase
MITYDLDQRGSEPKYEYLYHCIRKDIRLGMLAAGTRLPSKRALASHLSVSIGTVERAYDLLVSEGYAQAKRGSGYYVSPHRADGVYSDGSSSNLPEDEGWQVPLIDFKANRCSLELFPSKTWMRIMRRTLSEHNKALFETVPFNGLAELREAIAAYLYEFKGIHVSPDQIVVGAGTEYLYGRLMQLFGHRTTIAIGDPGYKKLSEISRSSGTLWDYIPVDEEGLEVDALASSPAQIVHVSPANHFPIGIVMSANRRKKLLDWVHQKPERYLVEDDYDSELRFNGRQQPPLFTQDTEQKVIYLNTFSKTMVPSLRISYVVLPKNLMGLYRSQMSFYSCTVSSFEQIALAEFISGGYFERHINRLRRYYGKQRIALVDAFNASHLPLIAQYRTVDVGTHLLVNVFTQLSDQEIVQAAGNRGMHLSMLSDYCARPTARSAHKIVINFASIQPDQMKTAIELLEGVFSEDIARALA